MITLTKYMEVKMSKLIVWHQHNNIAITHNVTAINVNNRSSMVTFNIETGGMNVDQVHLSMEVCQELGIINLEKLEKYCK